MKALLSLFTCLVVSLLSACQIPDVEELIANQHQADAKTATAPIEFEEIDKPSVTQTVSGRKDGKGFDLVFVADGFTQNEMANFHQAVENYVNFNASYESVFQFQQNAWNIHLISMPSNESGVDEPKSSRFKDTQFDASFECSWVDRVICVNQEKVLDTVMEYFPQYDAILVLANSTRNGGASFGNGIITSSMGTNLNNTIIHELGHLLANLGDEYSYGGSDVPSREPSHANLTLNSQSDSVKWKHWLPEDTSDRNLSDIGVYEGGNYIGYGVWRPSFNSVMRTLGYPFHEVNLEAWTLALYEHSGTYFSSSPEQGAIEQSTSTQSFEIELAFSEQLQNIEWRVNDQVVTNNGPINKLTLDDQYEDYIVQAKIYDRSGVVIKDDQKLSQDTLTWWVSIN